MFPCSRQIQWTQPLRYDLFVWSFGESVPRIKFYPATCRSWTKLLLVISIPATFQPSVIRFLCYVLLRSSSPPPHWSIYIPLDWHFSSSSELFALEKSPFRWSHNLALRCFPSTELAIYGQRHLLSYLVTFVPDGIWTSDIIKKKIVIAIGNSAQCESLM